MPLHVQYIILSPLPSPSYKHCWNTATNYRCQIIAHHRYTKCQHQRGRRRKKTTAKHFCHLHNIYYVLVRCVCACVCVCVAGVTISHHTYQKYIMYDVSYQWNWTWHQSEWIPIAFLLHTHDIRYSRRVKSRCERKTRLA